MSRRDQIVALVHDFLEEPAVDDVAIIDDARRLADRILDLIHPETPDPEMVNEVAIAIGEGFMDRKLSGDIARAALAAERKWWSE